jgi:hypothetical protein
MCYGLTIFAKHGLLPAGNAIEADRRSGKIGSI